MRTLMMVMVVLALACSGAWAATWSVSGGTNPQNVSINGSVLAYSQVMWNDTSIDFANDSTDWQSSTSSDGWYPNSPDGTTIKYANDAWATGYYESAGGADCWVDTNANGTMDVSGTAMSDGLGHSLQTWYTVAATNNTLTPAGFRNNGLNTAIASIPLDGPGCYLEEPSSGVLGFQTGTLLPRAIPADGGSRTLSLQAHAQGTLMFKGRMQRQGMIDVSGSYQGTLTVTFN